MKKLLAILLALTTLLSLAACGQEEQKEPLTTEKTGEVETEKEAKIPRGTVNGKVYSSTYSGLTFTAGEDWSFSSDEDILFYLNIKQDVYDDDLAVSLENTTQIYDMKAVDSKTGSDVCIGYEKLFLPETTAEEYWNSLKKKLEADTSIDIWFDEETATVTLGGHEYLRASAQVEIVGRGSTRYYYCCNIDGVMSIINATIYSNGYELAELEAMFA